MAISKSPQEAAQSPQDACGSEYCVKNSPSDLLFLKPAQCSNCPKDEFESSPVSLETAPRSLPWQCNLAVTTEKTVVSPQRVFSRLPPGTNLQDKLGRIFHYGKFDSFTLITVFLFLFKDQTGFL